MKTWNKGRRVKVVYPNGTVEHYKSRHAVERALGMVPTTIYNALYKGKPIQRGKYKGLVLIPVDDIQPLDPQKYV